MKRILCALLSLLALPWVAPWAWWIERKILREGRPLTDAELQFSKRLGLRQPEKARLLLVESIPLPAPQWLLKWARAKFHTLPEPAGMTLGHGILLDSAYEDCSEIILHELVHVRQHELWRGHPGFLWRYLYECMVYGYEDAPMEQEARRESLS